MAVGKPETRIVAHIDRPRGWVVRGGSDHLAAVAAVHWDRKDAIADAVRQLRASRTGGELTILSADGRRQEVRRIEPAAATDRMLSPRDLIEQVEAPPGQVRGVVTTVLVFAGFVAAADLLAGRVLGLSGAAYATYAVLGILAGAVGALWAGRRVGPVLRQQHRPARRP